MFLDENRIIYGYHTSSVMPESEVVYETHESFLPELNEKLGKIKYDGGIISDVVFDKPPTIEEIRALRLKKCFSVINRGQLWYNTLSEAQVLELQTWYQAWLDATDTLVIPEKPSWLE